jgi:hypothetical protein
MDGKQPYGAAMEGLESVNSIRRPLTTYANGFNVYFFCFFPIRSANSANLLIGTPYHTLPFLGAQRTPLGFIRRCPTVSPALSTIVTSSNFLGLNELVDTVRLLNCVYGVTYFRLGEARRDQRIKKITTRCSPLSNHLHYYQAGSLPAYLRGKGFLKFKNRLSNFGQYLSPARLNSGIISD